MALCKYMMIEATERLRQRMHKGSTKHYFIFYSMFVSKRSDQAKKDTSV